ncbi:MAG: hypothetical protein ACTSRA_13675 [Promethearchaeota archaeon]
MQQDLKAWFNKAGLEVEILDSVADKSKSNEISEIVDMNNYIFMAWISRNPKTKKEYFVIKPGHKDNIVQVIDANRRFKQVILQIKEPERTFVVRQWNRDKGRYEIIERKTDKFTRKYLMGMDERHLFIAELPRNTRRPINSVKDAHAALKPNHSESKKPLKALKKRQGEWFFLPVSHEEEKLILENKDQIKRRQPIGGGYRMRHVADFLIRIEGNTYVTGRVRDEEHRTVKLHGWFKAIHNLEAPVTDRRVKWID